MQGLETNLAGKGSPRAPELCHKCTFVCLGRLSSAGSQGCHLGRAGEELLSTAGSLCCPRQDCTGALERLLEVGGGPKSVAVASVVPMDKKKNSLILL